MEQQATLKIAHRVWHTCLTILLIAVLSASSIYGVYHMIIGAAENYYRSRYLAFTFETAGNDYAESTKKLPNPGGSFYNMTCYMLSDNLAENDLKKRIQSDIKAYSGEELILVEINLRRYKDTTLSDTALSQADQILTAWSEAGFPIILRFLYDWDGNAAATEPEELSLVKEHMSQVAPVVNAHKKDIYTMQGIFVGNYAEMHGGLHMDQKSMCALAKHLDSVIDPDIFLAVRTPAQRRTILNSAKTFPKNSTLAKRLGLYNDGMMGSDTDLGTYGTENRNTSTSMSDQWKRSQELDYQDELCRYVPNGGEAVIDNPLNDLDQAIDTLASMHVSYLSCMYQQEVIRKWKNARIQSGDVWNGKSGYDYIDAHMGSRYRCTGASATTFNFWTQDLTLMKFTMTNTGFSTYHESLTLTATVIAEGSTTPVTTKTWQDDALSTLTNGETCSFSLPLDLRSYADGNYHVYLSCTRAESGIPVAFATDEKSTEYGYKIASFSVSKIPTSLPDSGELLNRYLSYRRASVKSLEK